MQLLDELMSRLRGWCAKRAAEDETAGLDDRIQAVIRASGEEAA